MKRSLAAKGEGDRDGPGEIVNASTPSLPQMFDHPSPPPTHPRSHVKRRRPAAPPGAAQTSAGRQNKRSSEMTSAAIPAQIACVTGASSGLGAIFAQRLGERGFNLVVTGRDRHRLEEVRRRVIAGARDCAVTLVTADLATGDRVLTH